MNCQAVQDQLGLYVDGELPAQEASSLERHLETCPACAAELARLRALISRFQDDTDAREAVPPTDLWNRIEERLSQPRRPSILIRLLHRPLAMAASLALLLGAGVFMLLLLNPAPPAVQADTIDYRVLLDGISTDADAAVERFLKFYQAMPMDAKAIANAAPPLHFEIPQTLPGGYTLKASYRLQFGSKPGYAAQYRRDDEPIFVFFHQPVDKTLLGVHRDSHCALAKGTHSVEVGGWQLIHFTDPTTCHCLLSRSKNETELRSMLAAISPALTGESSPSQP